MSTNCLTIGKIQLVFQLTIFFQQCPGNYFCLQKAEYNLFADKLYFSNGNTVCWHSNYISPSKLKPNSQTQTEHLEIHVFLSQISIRQVCLPSCRPTRRVRNILPDNHLHRTCTDSQCSDTQPDCLNCTQFRDLSLVIPVKRPANNEIMKVIAFVKLNKKVQQHFAQQLPFLILVDNKKLCYRVVRVSPHQAKANAKAKIFFDVLLLILWSFQIVLWSFSLSPSLGVGIP